MPHSKQAKKRNRQSEERRLRNKNVKSRMKTALKRVGKVADGDRPAAMAEAMKRIDKAAKTSAIHKNAAARLKSRMARAAARKTAV